MPPKIQMLIFLVIIFLTAFLYHPTFNILATFLLCLGATVLADFIFLKIRGIKPFFPSAALVSGTIIGLLASANLPWYELAITGILAMFSKNFLRLERKHIFNPAGFGLLSASLLFRHGISWWAASFQYVDFKNILLLVSAVALFLPGLVSLLRMRRYLIFLSFFIIFFLLQRRIFFDPTTIFFSLVMLPEPMTTPVKYIPQILFGVFVALASFFVSYLSQYISLDPLIFPLLMANAAFFKWR